MHCLRSPTTGFALCLLLALGLLLYACQDQPPEPTGPSAAVASATKLLTIGGLGSGSGAVTVPPTGGQPAIDCRITAGQAAATGCSQSYPLGTVVTLTATPADGFSFSSWGAGCTGSGACQKTMDVDRTVNAKFTPASTLTVTGAGTGIGKVTSQPGLVPQIDCTITAGVAGATGCTGAYSSTTVVTLTATPTPGNVFTGWGLGCSGTGLCQPTMNIARTVKATFKALPQYTITVNAAGTGDGAVTSQPSLAPAISCRVTSGQTAATGCSAGYASGTGLVLTAAADSGHRFGGWGGACQPAGNAATCSLSVTQTASATVTFTPLGAPAPEATSGQWGPPFATPSVAIHAALTSDGRALLWGLNGQPWLWDPSTYPDNPGAGFTEVSWPSEMFCGGHTFLPDGKLIVIGGQIPALGYGYGISDVNTFGGGGWSTAAAMHYARWYPTATTLANGEVVALVGSDENAVTVPIPEVFDGVGWRELPGATLSLPLYPRTFVEPKLGRVFYAGENPITRYLDPSANGGAGAWISLGTRLLANRGYGSAVMLDGKVLYVGGGGGTCPTLPNSSAEIIDLHATNPAWRYVGSMTYRRRQINATILANGTVLVTGGTSACGFNDGSGALYPAELWDPGTEQWSVMASAGVPRTYHSVAVLLPDGRVLTGGGNNQSSAEVFTPPYLFASDGSPANRPSYTLGATVLSYGQSVTLQTPDAPTIEKVVLVRLGAATHASNQSQQFNTVAFAPATDGRSLVVTMPAGGNLAPPGPYMLFILNGQGVPSVARIVTLR
jgi:hypothetical protein